MTKTKKRPELRFRGFTEEWEEKELGSEVADITGGGTPSTSNPEYWNGNIDWYSPTEIGGEVYANGSVKQITELGLKNSSAKLLPAGKTILFTSRAGIGDVAILQRSGTTNQGFQSLILKEGYNTYFFYSMGHLIKQFAEKYSSGSTFLEISGKTLGHMTMDVPSAIEQLKIGSFFQYLDALIALHQRKHDKLYTLKKAMLEKMFPREGADVPEIRFKGFTGKWESRKIGEILTERKRPIDLEDSRQYELVTVKRRNEGVVSRGMLKGKDILVKNYYEIRAGDYVISKRQIVHGANGIVPQNLDKAIVSNEYLVAVGNNNITTDFWTVISKLPDMYKKFFLSSYGVDIEKLVFDVEDWKKRNIEIPTVDEQNRITAFFKNLDALIFLHQRELDKLKNIKKACLEKMFI
jgi:type I restriction enzyme S subunit